MDEFVAAGISKKLGIIGFCFGGGQLIDALAQDGGACFGIGVSFYGTRIDPSVVANIKVLVLFIVGDNDPSCPDYRWTRQNGDLERADCDEKDQAARHINASETKSEDGQAQQHCRGRRITLLREGCRGSLSEKIMKKYNLREKVQGQHQTYALGIKEVWEIDSSKHEPGHVLHTLGWPLDNKTHGGSFLYHMKDRQVSLGLVVALNYHNPFLNPYEEFQETAGTWNFTLRLISFGYDYHWVFLYMHAMFWNPQKSWSAHIKVLKLERMGNLLCCVQVDQSIIAIKERFGKFDEVLEPGCHFMPWCLGRKVAGHLTLRLQQLDVRCETKTKDNVFVNVVASIQYRALANKGSDAFYRLSNTRTQIQAYVFDGIDQSKCSKAKPRHDAFEQKNEIARAVEDELEKAMSAYGYEIVQTLIVDIEPDEHVKRAMNEINAAARLRVAANEKAEAEKIVQIKRAEGDAESKYLAGLGIARQRQAIVDGLRESVLGFSVNVPGTIAKDVMDMVLITQYFDTMKEIGASSKSSTVFIPHGPGAVREIAEQIRDGLLQASSAQQEATLL
ncbi:unnamed protein product [Camellia sinensis]